MNSLWHRYPGETCWIVGKGPSLAHLSKGYFGRGPVIALNDAIVVVQALELSNPIYSLQKDGQEEFMVKPNEDVTLILQGTPGYSKDWYPEHPKRVLVDPIRELGFDHITVMATRMAIAIARRMGCDRVQMMCFDNLVTGSLDTYNPRKGTSLQTGAAFFYKLARPYIFGDLKTIKHEFITPNRADRENMLNLHGDNTK